MAVYSSVVLPHHYRTYISLCQVNPLRVLIVESGSQYMSDTALAAFEELGLYELEVVFTGLTELEGYGYRGWKDSTLKALRFAASSSVVLTVDKTPLSASLLASRRAYYKLPADAVAPQAKLVASEIVDSIGALPKPPIEERMRALNPGGPDITFVIPAHNAERTINRAVESVVTQDYPVTRMELIIVDDASADDTWGILQNLVSKHGNLIRIMRIEEPSGTPAAPRNLGISLARGTYIFFLDADDWMESNAVRSMLEHALDWNSDILLVRIEGEGGRSTPRSMFRVNQPNANKWHSNVMWTLAPYKLFKRSLVKDLRFPKGMPEDIPFVLSALNEAATVSVASDRVYYHLTFDGERHASLGIWVDPDACIEAYSRIFPQAASMNGFTPNCALARRLLKIDVCRTLIAIACDSEALIDERLSALSAICSPLVKGNVINDIGGVHSRLLECLSDSDGNNLIRVISEMSEREMALIFEQPKDSSHIPGKDPATESRNASTQETS